MCFSVGDVVRLKCAASIRFVIIRIWPSMLQEDEYDIVTDYGYQTRACESEMILDKNQVFDDTTDAYNRAMRGI